MTDMPLTVGDLLKTPGLPLKAVAGQKGRRPRHPVGARERAGGPRRRG